MKCIHTSLPWPAPPAPRQSTAQRLPSPHPGSFSYLPIGSVFTSAVLPGSRDNTPPCRYGQPLRRTSGLPASEAQAGAVVWALVCTVPWLHPPRSGASTCPRAGHDGAPLQSAGVTVRESTSLWSVTRPSGTVAAVIRSPSAGSSSVARPGTVCLHFVAVPRPRWKRGLRYAAAAAVGRGTARIRAKAGAE